MKFTVAIPAYKAKFLSEAIESVLSQTYTDFELVIVDDASPENIEGICAKYKDCRIKYFRNARNCGAEHVVDNWNICLSKAAGDFFLCMGDDDMLVSNCLETYLKLIEKHPGLDVYHGRTILINEKSNVISVLPQRDETENVYQMMKYRLSGGVQFLGDFLYRTSFIKSMGGFFYLPFAWCSDDITAYIAAGKKGIANTSIPVFSYRQNQYSITTSGHYRQKLEALLKASHWYDDFLFTPLGMLCKESSVYADYKYVLGIKDRYFIPMFRGYVKADIKSSASISSFMYWYSRRKELSLTKRFIIGLLLRTIKYSICKPKP